MTRHMTTVDGQPGWVWHCNGPGCAVHTTDPHLSGWISLIAHGQLGDASSTRDYHAASCLLLSYGWSALSTIFRNLSAGQLPPSGIPQPVLYLIHDREHNGWWRRDRAGYTQAVDEAGRYSEVEALDIARESALAGNIGLAVTLVAAPDNWLRVEQLGQAGPGEAGAPS